MEDPECMPLMAIATTSQELKERNSNIGVTRSETHLSESPLQPNSDDTIVRASSAFDKSGRSCVERSTSPISSNTQLNDQLVKAVKDGDDIIKIQSLLRAKASPNAVDDSSYLSCAQIATKSGQADVLQLLFEYNADPRVVEDGKTLLHLTIKKKDLNCLKVIIQTGVDINQVDIKQNESVLYAAVNAEWTEGVRELLNHHPDMEGRYGNNKKTVLQQAIVTKNIDVVKSIVSHARSYDNFEKIVNVKNKDNMTPLFIAVLENNLDLLKVLLSAQPDVMLQDKSKRNVLHWAAEKGHSQIIEELFKQNPNEMNQLAEQLCEGKVEGTPLHIAISRGSDKCVKYLIEQAKVSLSYKADVADHRNCNILHIASNSDKSEVLKYFSSLLHRTKDDGHNLLSKLVYEGTLKGETPLHFALKRRQIDYIYALIAAGSDLTAKCVEKSNSYRTAIDIMIYQVPSAVEILNNIFDKSIQRNKHSTSVTVDYKVLMPEAERENRNIPGKSQTGKPSEANFKGDSFGVMKALQKTGDRLGQRKLLEHPLVESFVHLHWKRLEGPYFVLVTLSGLYALFLSLFVLHRLTHPKIYEAQWIFQAFMICCMIPLFLHEMECFKESQPWEYRAEGILKLSCFALSIYICIPKTAREISAFAVLIAWLEVVLLISRIPHYGHHMLMFIEIAFKYSKLLLSFVFVLFGFVVAFMVIFGLQKPFNLFWLAVVKIVVMMTNELEYDSFNEKLNETIPSTFSQILAMGVFILFVVFISLVLTNLFVAVAVNDIKKLHLISKQASFLGVYDAFLFSKPTQKSWRGTMQMLFLGGCAVVCLFSTKLVERRELFGQVKSSIEIDVLIDDEVARFPEDLSSSLIQKGYENREKYLKEFEERKEINTAEKLKLEEKKSLMSGFEEMLSAFEHKMNAKLGELSEQVLELGASNKYKS